MLRTVLSSLALCLFSFTTPGADNGLYQMPAPETEENVAGFTSGVSLTFAEKQLFFEKHLEDVYDEADLKKTGLSFDVFRKAVIGFHNFKQKQLVSPSKSIITVVDFTKSSRDKRMWIIDLKSKKLLFNNLVAHGRNTGEDKALNFSNKANSNMSSIGFYLTGKTYFGKHGLSLKLDGMDEKYNSNARDRAIVVHGADYATEKFVKQYGRLGRSLGCPAVPREISKEVIEHIKDNTVMYIHSADKNYNSSYLNPATAVEVFALEAVAQGQTV
ncbi:murein L,D-transpeptidase catalytic domain family protein [Pontibacter ruber]|uniref:Murein L,D-transpeptidase catalytic domain family protein n=1 Tax=Pontibacter ruber TaxID=1343895 RepID=A0ABW5CRN7_9BACT|nr:murein L,D-transpeptidase catalytic domain family protein [Pontibacter ruber]